jgi:hypothetical protein
MRERGLEDVVLVDPAADNRLLDDAPGGPPDDGAADDRGTAAESPSEACRERRCENEDDGEDDKHDQHDALPKLPSVPARDVPAAL